MMTSLGFLSHEVMTQRGTNISAHAVLLTKPDTPDGESSKGVFQICFYVILGCHGSQLVRNIVVVVVVLLPGAFMHAAWDLVEMAELFGLQRELVGSIGIITT